MITFPTDPLTYQFAPWTDPNGVRWIYNASKTRWARYTISTDDLVLTDPLGARYKIILTTGGGLSSVPV